MEIDLELLENRIDKWLESETEESIREWLLAHSQNLSKSDEALHIADVISRLSDEQIDSIIYNLDEYARDYDDYQHGLPTHGKHIKNMRILVKQFLNGL